MSTVRENNSQDKSQRQVLEPILSEKGPRNTGTDDTKYEGENVEMGRQRQMKREDRSIEYFEQKKISCYIVPLFTSLRH